MTLPLRHVHYIIVLFLFLIQSAVCDVRVNIVTSSLANQFERYIANWICPNRTVVLCRSSESFENTRYMKDLYRYTGLQSLDTYIEYRGRRWHHLSLDLQSVSQSVNQIEELLLSNILVNIYITRERQFDRQHLHRLIDFDLVNHQRFANRRFSPAWVVYMVDIYAYQT